MILEVKAKNCYIFDEEIIFSLEADMRNKKFSYNVYSENNFNILKSAGIYGANNSGKTSLLKCIRSIIDVLKQQKPNKITSNIFLSDTISDLGITFVEGGKTYSYSFKFDTNSEEYIYEKFVEIIRDQYGNKKELIYFERDTVNKLYRCDDKDLQKSLPIISKENILIYLLDTGSFEIVKKVKDILISFSSKVDILNMNNIPMKHTIEIMKGQSPLRSKIVNFIKNADLYLENFMYIDDDEIKSRVKLISNGDGVPEEKVLESMPEELIQKLCLVSVYKGRSVPSLLFDSTGTKKIAALASYVIEALENGRMLLVDELDSSIHFKLTRAIVAMFNNELNTNAQLIFTSHDISLMDCQKMFRKEQIWFVHKDSNGVYVYSLGEFTAEQGVRDTSAIRDIYMKGMFGALPEPELINSLINLKSENRGDQNE